MRVNKALRKAIRNYALVCGALYLMVVSKLWVITGQVDFNIFQSEGLGTLLISLVIVVPVVIAWNVFRSSTSDEHRKTDPEKDDSQQENPF